MGSTIGDRPILQLVHHSAGVSPIFVGGLCCLLIFIADEAWHTTGANWNLCDTADPVWYYFWSSTTAKATPPDNGSWRRAAPCEGLQTTVYINSKAAWKPS